MFACVIIPSLIGEELFTLVFYKSTGAGLAGWAVSTTLFVLVHGFEYHMEYMATPRACVHSSSIHLHNDTIQRADVRGASYYL